MDDSVYVVLEKSVRLAVGSASATPREGQAALCAQIEQTMSGRSKAAAEAPTGSGKTFAYLAPAMCAAARRGERTVVSTGSLALQSQIVTKDAPVVSQATELVFDYLPKTAILKGWSNYACLLQAQRHAGPLAEWVRGQAELGGSGERDAVPFALEDQEWSEVSVSTTECVGVSRCRFGSDCFPARAREDVAAADIVVTNHSLLAIQAMNRAAVVTGSTRVGHIEHLVVDEAHDLAATVRKQGQVYLDGDRVVSVARHFDRMHPDSRPSLPTATTIAKMLDDSLTGAKNPPAADLLAPVGQWIAARLRSARSVRNRNEHDVKWWKLVARLEKVKDDIAILSEGKGDWAYWVEEGRWKASPVNVGGMLVGNVYQASEPLSVSLVSATLPQGVVADTGVSARVKKYPSPFAAAYAKSLLYVPTDAPTSPGANGKSSLDLAKHVEWATGEITSLVKANGGSALVLSATSAAGRHYAAALRKALPKRITVLSQWDGASARRLVESWRDDRSSVLVGTRSFMTGVDAPGGTCSLVIVDRVPRAPSNPVDQARAALIMERGDYDKWAADRLVYVSDAALLLEQAVGRLVRRVDDKGVVAILDPRLSRYSKARYPEPTRRVLLETLSLFTRRTRERSEALEWIGRQAGL